MSLHLVLPQLIGCPAQVGALVLCQGVEDAEATVPVLVGDPHSLTAKQLLRVTVPEQRDCRGDTMIVNGEPPLLSHCCQFNI